MFYFYVCGVLKEKIPSDLISHGTVVIYCWHISSYYFHYFSFVKAPTLAVLTCIFLFIILNSNGWLEWFMKKNRHTINCYEYCYEYY